VQKQGGSYALTPLAEDYLLETSPTYFGDVFDLDLADPFSFENLEKVVLTNTQQVYGGGNCADFTLTESICTPIYIPHSVENCAFLDGRKRSFQPWVL